VKLALFAVLGAFVCASCSSSVCDVGASRCAGAGEIEVCSVGSDPEVAAHWERSECFDPSPLCIEASTGASYCVADATPNPTCPAAQEAGAKQELCDGDDRVVACVEGLALYYIDCGDGACVSDDS